MLCINVGLGISSRHDGRSTSGRFLMQNPFWRAVLIRHLEKRPRFPRAKLLAGTIAQDLIPLTNATSYHPSNHGPIPQTTRHSRTPSGTSTGKKRKENGESPKSMTSSEPASGAMFALEILLLSGKREGWKAPIEEIRGREQILVRRGGPMVKIKVKIKGEQESLESGKRVAFWEAGTVSMREMRTTRERDRRTR